MHQSIGLRGNCSRTGGHSSARAVQPFDNLGRSSTKRPMWQRWCGDVVFCFACCLLFGRREDREQYCALGQHGGLFGGPVGGGAFFGQYVS